ncbi:malic enzyme-like NAD(P)-binding protein [Clostridiaceae bacterium HSG29]|nr:malic enzyme-like NAD(P)-binding protein [Clostridiaceae bacterium HSG29]
MDYNKMALEMHEKHKGKIEVTSKVKLKTKDDLSIAYTPGVAEPCRKIHDNVDDVYKYTSKGNLVAVVSDGTAVLGLGDIGPEAALPVMEGKSILFKAFANIDAFPICLDTKDVDEIIQTVKMIAPTFGGINLEDISSPRCVEIERRLKDELNIPVFHDDQHGTAVVVSSAIINALKIVNKKINEIKIVVNGAGAAGNAITKMLINLGVENILVCDRKGILSSDKENGNVVKDEIALLTNKEKIHGDLKEAMKNADVFIGVSAKDVLTVEMAKSMNSDAIVFAMANPDPEISPEKAKEADVRIYGTGRSDYANQINNVLAFPGIFRGALDAKASDINEEMKVAAAYAIASLVDEKDLKEDNVIVSALDERVAIVVSKAVYDAAIKSGVARI